MYTPEIEEIELCSLWKYSMHIQYNYKYILETQWQDKQQQVYDNKNGINYLIKHSIISM